MRRPPPGFTHNAGARDGSAGGQALLRLFPAVWLAAACGASAAGGGAAGAGAGPLGGRGEDGARVAPPEGTAQVASPEGTAQVARRAGFTPGDWAAQRDLERRFLAVPRADSAAASAARLARHPHPSGSPAAATVADSLARRLAALGFRVEVDSFLAWLPHPVSLGLELRESAGAKPRPLAVREPSPEDAAGDGPDWWLTWHAYAASGRAEAEVVYANYGRGRDFEALEALGVDVRGKVVLARFGHVYRGVKVREAEARGAVGVVLYPDPAEDGYARGDTLPAGPYRPGRAVQRGTLAELSRYTGDPLTPGRPARPGVPRLSPEDAPNLPGLPVLSLGYAEAARVLEALGGPEPPDGFSGGLPVSYRVGPGPARLGLDVRLDNRLRPVRNVIARLPARSAGASEGRVVLGNHYDAWLYGGVDAHGGTAVLLEVARGLASLAAEGWRPRREVVLAFWDAEEFGVVGSTEWVEAHLDDLRGRTAAYLNLDTYTAGVLDVSGSPALRDLVVDAASSVPDPETGRTLAALWRDRQAESEEGSVEGPAEGVEAAEPREPVEPTEPTRVAAGADLPRLGDLGAGSDWSAFLHHAGVPSLQFTMNGRGVYAVYHSALDDADYLRRHADPGLAHAPAMARVMGLVALRLAEARLLPHRYDATADWLDARLDELEGDLRERGWLKKGAAAAADGIGVEASLAEARAATERLRAAARRLEALRRDVLEGPAREPHLDSRPDADRSAAVDRALLAAEAAFLDEEGLPGRPWYRHQAIAADSETGYGPLPLPAAREGLREEDPAAAARGLDRLASAVDRAAEELLAALGGAGRGGRSTTRAGRSAASFRHGRGGRSGEARRFRSVTCDDFVP